MTRSIIQTEKECFKTKYTYGLDRHHIFCGAFRSKSEKFGLWVWLRHDVHMWLHNTSEGQKYSEELMQIGQRRFEEIHGHEKFMKVFKKNHLEESEWII